MERGNQTTHERILTAAEKLFAEKGYKETTTREIVREAGASLSSLQAHFQGKENVYFQVRCRAIEELYQFMRPSLEEVAYMDGQGLLYGETAWNLLYELVSKYAAWCFDPKNRYAIALIGREMLDGSPVQDLPEEKIKSVLAYVRLLCLRYVGTEEGDWVLLLGHTIFSTMLGMASASHQDAWPEESRLKRSFAQPQIKYQVKNYVLLTLRAYLDIRRAQPQAEPPKAGETAACESKQPCGQAEPCHFLTREGEICRKSTEAPEKKGRPC